MRKEPTNLAVGYARVSTLEQADDGQSMCAQVQAIRDYCRLRGLDLVEVVEDPGVSAGKSLSERPGGEVIQQHIKGGVSNVVAWKLDRLFRNTSDCLTQVEGWERGGVSLHLIDMGGQAVDTSSAMGRFFLTVMAAAAEMERTLIRERTRAALGHRRRNGQSVGGIPPYGYHQVDGFVIPDEHEQKTMKTMKRLRARRYSYQKIAEALHRKGQMNRNGGTWTRQSIARTLARNEAWMGTNRSDGGQDEY